MIQVTKPEDSLWVEKYRPRRIEDCILPKALSKLFTSYVQKEEIPHFLFYGSSGIGKTTVARALGDSIGADVMMINGSLSGNIDTLRDQIQQFASTTSFASTSHKIVIIDEADYTNPTSFQPALRAFMEEFSGNCRFILTCNFPEKILDAIKSRCILVEFRSPKDERAPMLAAFDKRLQEILSLEGIVYDPDVLSQVILRYFPDFRKTLDQLQASSVTGELCFSSLSVSDSEVMKELRSILKKKDFLKLRSWVHTHGSQDGVAVYRHIYNDLFIHAKPETLPNIVILLADYMYRSAFVADFDICLLGCLTEIMSHVELKQ